MRELAACVAVLSLLALTFCPNVSVAQSNPGDEGAADDPAGDQVLVSPTGNSSAPSGYDDVDALRVWVANENTTGLDIAIKMVSWERPPPQEGGARTGFRTLEAGFEIDGQRYVIEVDAFECRAESQSGLQAWNPGARNYRLVRCIDVTIDAANETGVLHLMKDDLLDGQGLPPRRGTQIEGLHAMAWTYVETFSSLAVSITGLDASPQVVDRAPDEGSAPPFGLKVSNSAQGLIELSSPTPVRFSNGESTTMVFEVLLENFGSSAETVFLELRDLEESWTGRVPARVRLEAAGSATVPVILSTEFTHRHGETGLFQVVAKPSSGGRETSLPLGVRWADVPQPAGHHNVLYFHSKPTGATNPLDPVFGIVVSSPALWANTLETDPDRNASDLPAKSNWYAERQTEAGVEFYQGWTFPLDPGLLMGLDLDAQQQGLARLAFQSGIGDVTSKISVQVLYCDPSNIEGVYPGTAGCMRGSWFPLAEGSLGPFSPGQQTKATHEIPMQVVESRDQIPFVPGSNLRLHIEYLHNQAALGFDQVSPTMILKESTVVLPLSEYHDPIDQAFAGVGSVHLEPRSTFAKEANPGRSSVFSFRLENRAPSEQEIALSVEGHNAAWARLAVTGFHLAPGEAREFAVTVDVPIDASSGERAELFVVAENVKDPASVGIARLRTSVVEGRDIPNEIDESDVDLGEGTPGPTFLLVLIAIAASVAASRRRRL